MQVEYVSLRISSLTPYSDTIKIEDVLKNITDRSAWTKFNGTMAATMRSDYFSECELVLCLVAIHIYSVAGKPKTVI